MLTPSQTKDAPSRRPPVAASISAEVHRGSEGRAGSAMLDPEGRACGSLLVIDVTDSPEAAGFAEADPYARAGLFESVVIRPYRVVFRDRELVA